MIFKELIIENFGLYNGKHVIDLSPNNRGNRNITLIYGQNGVGKTTVLEAIQLCLSGPFYLGERVSVVDYEAYLQKRVYKNPSEKYSLRESSVEMKVDYERTGTTIQYRFIRSWSNNPEGVNEQISIFENEKEIKKLNFKEKNFFIRELISPGFSKVMFFDGEKLQRINEEGVLNTFMADCCHSLFGLNLVHILQRDIDQYTTKLQSDQSNTEVSDEIAALSKDIASLVEEKEKLVQADTLLAEEQNTTREKIAKIEASISEKGRWITDKMDDLEGKRKKIEIKIENDKKSLMDIYNGLGPFTLAKELCLRLKEKLIQERSLEKWKNAEQIVSSKMEELHASFLNLAEWGSISDKTQKERLVLAFKKMLLNETVRNSRKDIIHELTESERATILIWIDEIINELPKKIADLTDSLEKNEISLKELNKDRATFSDENIVQEFLAELQDLNRRMGTIENERKSKIRKIDEVQQKIQFWTERRNSALRKETGMADIDKKLKLANKTKLILEEYSENLLVKKLKKLEKVLLEKFNILCRKTNYFDSASIDKKTFNVILYKGKQEISQEHLSAGEKQLLALSMLWSLHTISNVSLPFVIDTPVARLDKKHRNSVVRDLLPSISEQVIVLGTENELNVETVKQLRNSLQNYYELKYDFKNHSTKLIEQDIVKQMEELEV